MIFYPSLVLYAVQCGLCSYSFTARCLHWIKFWSSTPGYYPWVFLHHILNGIWLLHCLPDAVSILFSGHMIHSPNIIYIFGNGWEDLTWKIVNKYNEVMRVGSNTNKFNNPDTSWTSLTLTTFILGLQLILWLGGNVGRPIWALSSPASWDNYYLMFQHTTRTRISPRGLVRKGGEKIEGRTRIVTITSPPSPHVSDSLCQNYNLIQTYCRVQHGPGLQPLQ